MCSQAEFEAYVAESGLRHKFGDAAMDLTARPGVSRHHFFLIDITLTPTSLAKAFCTATGAVGGEGKDAVLAVCDLLGAAHLQATVTRTDVRMAVMKAFKFLCTDGRINLAGGATAALEAWRTYVG